MQHKTIAKITGGVTALLGAFLIGTYVDAIGWWSSVAAAQSASPAVTGTSFTITADQNVAPENVDMQQFYQVWQILQSRFVQTHASTSSTTPEDHLYGAIKGLTDSYNDPYTTFFPPEDASIFEGTVQGSFGGIGAEIGMKDGLPAIIAPLKDSPAEHAGLRSGDVIYLVNATSTQGMNADDAVKLIRGEVGTKVMLTIRRDDSTTPIQITITRDTINVPVIKNYLRSDGVYVIELYSFTANSADLFRSALRDFMTSGSTKLVLDLRGNPGGYLDAAVQMASYFLPIGETVVTEDYMGRQTNVTQTSLGYDVFKNKKLSMAILIDQGSASASEILAGALSQHGVAKLIGTRSFGKGSVQEMLTLNDGAALKVTIARWLTPNGTSISDNGLTPDIEKDRTAKDALAGKDPQMDSAVLYLVGQ